MIDAFLHTVRGRGTADIEARQQEAVAALLGRLFPQQKAFVLDGARRKSALCPRRAGKTYACVATIMMGLFAKSGARILYMAKTRNQAENLVWLPLKDISTAFGLSLKFNETFLTATAPNGSFLQLHGADNLGEIDKHRGQAFDKVIIDEAGTFDITLMNTLVNAVIQPALNDRFGQLILTGTPGPVLAGMFYEATSIGAPGVRLHGTTIDGPTLWSFHKWTQADNVAMPHIWELSLKDKAARNLADDDPVWRREYLGEWCPSDDLMVYKLGNSTWLPDSLSKNPHGLPDAHDWYYLLGIDFGFEDDFACVVSAWSPSSSVFYQVWDYKAPHVTIGQMAEVITAAISRFGEFHAMIADTGGFGKSLLATLVTDYGFPFEAAEKREKRDYIELVNSDLRSGKLMIRHNSLVHREMELLQWLDHRRIKENKATPNHAADALIYTWRYAQHHHSKPRAPEITEGSTEWVTRKRLDAREKYRRQRYHNDDLQFVDYDDLGLG